MKTMAALTGLALAATLGCSTIAFAQSDIPNIDVTARRFHENAPVAVTGTVAARVGNDLIISRPDGDFRARISEPTDYTRLWVRPVASRVSLGDSVTVYGRLRKMPGEPRVIADAVVDSRDGRVMLTETGDRAIADMPLPARLHYDFFG